MRFRLETNQQTNSKRIRRNKHTNPNSTDALACTHARTHIYSQFETDDEAVKMPPPFELVHECVLNAAATVNGLSVLISGIVSTRNVNKSRAHTLYSKGKGMRRRNGNGNGNTYTLPPLGEYVIVLLSDSIIRFVIYVYCFISLVFH